MIHMARIDEFVEYAYRAALILILAVLMYCVYCQANEQESQPEVQTGPQESQEVAPTVTATPTPEPEEIIYSEFTEDFSEDVSTCVFYATRPIGRYYITAYSDKETGSKLTASGGKVHSGTITTCASDTRYLKFGTYIEVGGRIYRCEDTGSAVKKKHVDLYFETLKEVKKYGSHYETIYEVSFPFGKPKDN